MMQVVMQDLALLLYKVGCLSVGALFAYMGYRLFMLSGRPRPISPAGVTGSAPAAPAPEATGYSTGDVEWQFGKSQLKFKNAAPGAYFSVCGTVIVGFTVFAGLQFNHTILVPVDDNVAPDSASTGPPPAAIERHAKFDEPEDLSHKPKPPPH